jgi:YD repeat-containing protein
MKTRLLYIVVLLISLAGCLEKETEQEPEKEVCQLLSSTTTLVNHEGSRYNYSLTYSYNGEGQLVRIASPDTSSFRILLEYDAQKRLTKEQFDKYTWTSEYNAQGQVIKQVRQFEFAPDRYETCYLLHTYDSKNKLTEAKYYAAESEGDVLVYTYQYTYTNDKLSGIEMVSEQDERHSLATLVTDDKKAPIPALPMHLLYMFRDETVPGIGLLTSNITNYNVMHGEGEMGFRSFAAKFTYNTAGYPTSVTRNYVSGATETTTYNYSCR